MEDGCFLVNKFLGGVNIENKNIDDDDIGVFENDNLKNYTNIALLGIDSRKDDYGVGNRSDTIMIMSINNKTQAIKIFSVYRDTYLQVEENNQKKLDKVTHAYAYGGAKNTLLALNTNLDLNIKKYVTINFDSLIYAVDALGGITIDVQKDEVNNLNEFIDNTIRETGNKSTHVKGAGKQTLDGVQALAYARIRYTSGGDYRRAERQRLVVQAMVTKAKTLSPGELINVAETVIPKLSTNYSKTDLALLAPKLAKADFSQNIGWPYYTKGITLDRWYGIPTTLELNVKKLHQDVFGDTDYEPSNTVQQISKQIEQKTGYHADTSNIIKY